MVEGQAEPRRGRVVLHLDMDAFYASIEQRDDPRLKGRPVIVGSPPDRRGVVCAASYEARKFGVRSAMPSMTAGRLCPRGVFVRPRMEVYRDESRRIMAFLRSLGGLMERTSIDEAYVELDAASPSADPDEALRRAVEPVATFKKTIQRECGLTCSVGVAPNKMLAKIASDFKKPDGLTLILNCDKVEFLKPLSVAAIHGVGKVTAGHLQGAGIMTIGDLQKYEGDLRTIVGSWGPTLRQFAFGEDDRPLDLGEVPKSISSEETFDRDTADRRVLRDTLRSQAKEVAGSLRKQRLAAQSVHIKVRYHDFTTLTRQISVDETISEPAEIYRLACFLLAREKLVNRPLRLLGVGVGTLTPPSSQLRFEF